MMEVALQVSRNISKSYHFQNKILQTQKGFYTERRQLFLNSKHGSPSRSLNSANLGKTRGIGAGRKLKSHRRRQRWADQAYKKSHLGNEWNKPFAGSSHAKGIVLEKTGIEAKQPNSAIQNDEVLIAGFGCKGHAVGDIPGVRFKVVKVSGVSLLVLFKETKREA
ncbi:hypothetical protein RD792_014017 [Penstemon davidsonii]|uniref:Ribosomal protein S12 n=1 Tax=Penstemon davidsonii TaxID=160366 RepID=A0ABR0CQ02_9LAMI|nr:hypothetical protein RD792_014017 [Penstemon davidsonii]